MSQVADPSGAITVPVLPTPLAGQRSATTPAAIALRDVRKRFGDHEALRGISFEVGRGEVFALLGPNGAGKTTTIDILTGLTAASSGTVSVLGVTPAAATPADRARIGVVAQERADLAELRVGEVVAHFAALYPTPRPVAEVLDLVGLSTDSGRRIRVLSGGQRRRLDIALGIVGNPEVLFLDEPTVGLDAAVRRELWEIVRGLAASATTIVLTTHYLDEADALADRVGVLVGGELAALAAPRELAARAYGQVTVRWREEGSVREVVTQTPATVLRELLARYEGEVPELSVHRPSLEEAYLALLAEVAAS